MAKEKKRDPVRLMLVITAILAVLAIAAAFFFKYIGDMKETALDRRIAEVEEINRKKDEEYAAEMAKWEQEHASNANEAWPSHEPDGWDIVDLTNYPLENPRTVTLARADIMNNGMLLVNQWHSRPDDFSEESLESIGKYARGAIQVDNYNINLFPVAIDALLKAVDDAKAAGYEYYTVDAGYRSWDDQNTLFQKKMDSLKSKYNGDELIERTKREVNYPGTSEFNSGLSFTMHLYHKDDTEVNSPAYTSTEQAKWLNENCWKYGLVWRFPLTDFPIEGTLDKSYKTGVSVKLRCYRYVGVGNATVMHLKDFCLEEYIDYLAEHPHIAVFEDGTLRYEISRQYAGDRSEVQVQLAGNARRYTTSLDNMGYTITVFEY